MDNISGRSFFTLTGNTDWFMHLTFIVSGENLLHSPGTNVCHRALNLTTNLFEIPAAITTSLCGTLFQDAACF